MPYHINPESGEPGKCRAKKYCPFGEASEHYDSKDQARLAYELKMGSADPKRFGRSVSDKLRRRSDEEAYEEELRLLILKTRGALRINSFTLRETHNAIEQAEHYGLHRERALNLALHGLALQARKRKIERAAMLIIQEAPRAFRADVLKTSPLLEKKPGIYGSPTILTPGSDSHAHEALRPVLEKLSGEYTESVKELEDLEAEAVELVSAMKRESAMSTESRAKLSPLAEALYEQALGEKGLPSEEAVKDRRAWQAARRGALDELEAKGLLS